MRIIGYIKHPVLKITVFQMDNRLSVKLETGLYEQTYKFRQGGMINTLEDVKKIITEEFTQAVLDQVEEMHQIKNTALKRMHSEKEDSFDDII
ncbi:MAG: hypothetical protein AAFO07_27720 [Bacteroidota bacterium]